MLLYKKSLFVDLFICFVIITNIETINQLNS